MCGQRERYGYELAAALEADSRGVLAMGQSTLYPLLYNRAVSDATVAATGEHIIWARSAWAGCQRYPLHWGGDSSANWHKRQALR